MSDLQEFDMQGATEAHKQKREELRIAELEAEVARLRGVLASLRSEKLDADSWGIKCIEDHNAIIDEALAQPGEGKEVG